MITKLKSIDLERLRNEGASGWCLAECGGDKCIFVKGRYRIDFLHILGLGGTTIRGIRYGVRESVERDIWNWVSLEGGVEN